MGKKNKQLKKRPKFEDSLAKRSLASQFNARRPDADVCSMATVMTLASDQGFPIHTATLTTGDAYMKNEERIATAACHALHKHWTQRLAPFYTANDLYSFRSEMCAVIDDTLQELGENVDDVCGKRKEVGVTSMTLFGDLLAVAAWGDSDAYLVRKNRVVKLDERSKAAEGLAIHLPSQSDDEYRELWDEVGESGRSNNDSQTAVSLYQLKRGDLVVGWTKPISTKDANFLGVVVKHLRKATFDQDAIDEAVHILGCYSLKYDNELPSVSVAAMWMPPKKTKKENGRKANTKKKEKKNGSK